jgi:uncharacterized protein (DUF433 family)
MNRFGRVAASFLVAVTVGLAMGASVALAARGHKVDCAKVMSELNAGKKPKDVAKELKISRSSVYRCRRKERKAAKKAEKSASKTSTKTGTSSTK